MIPLLVVATVSGDSTNYWIGRFAGKRLLARHSRWLRPEHIAKTHEFYERHGGKTVILARFAPIVRTFAFCSRYGKMTYRHFVGFSMLGSCIWVGGFVTAGRLFGNLPIVKQNLKLYRRANCGVVVIARYARLYQTSFLESGLTSCLMAKR